MRREGYPRLFWAQSAILGRFQSWPVCPRRVRYRQRDYSRYDERTWGVFTMDARELGESEIRHVSVSDEWTHVTDRRFIEWLIDSDQHSDAVLVFPDDWHSLTPLVDEFVRQRQLEAFCILCNRTHAHKGLTKKDDDTREIRGSSYNRLYCPEGHLLMLRQTLRRILTSSRLMQADGRKKDQM